MVHRPGTAYHARRVRRRIRRGGYPSRTAAAAVLATLHGPRRGDRGGRILAVGDWLAHWLVSRTSPAASTMRGYAAHVRLYLAPYIGNVLLAELSAAHVQAMFTAIIRQHQALGSPVTAATLNRIRATLRAALNAAVRRGLIADNPAGRAELPRARRPRAVVWTPARVEHWQRTGERPAVAVWTAAQTAQFLHSADFGQPDWLLDHIDDHLPGVVVQRMTQLVGQRVPAAMSTGPAAASAVSAPSSPGPSSATPATLSGFPAAITSPPITAPPRSRCRRGTGRSTACRCAATAGSTARSTWPRSPRSVTSTAPAAPITTRKQPKEEPIKMPEVPETADQ